MHHRSMQACRRIDQYNDVNLKVILLWGKKTISDESKDLPMICFKFKF